MLVTHASAGRRPALSSVSMTLAEAPGSFLKAHESESLVPAFSFCWQVWSQFPLWCLARAELCLNSSVVSGRLFFHLMAEKRSFGLRLFWPCPLVFLFSCLFFYSNKSERCGKNRIDGSLHHVVYWFIGIWDLGVVCFLSTSRSSVFTNL